MIENASHFVVPWLNFYMLTGTSAAALTGLMFVVITLVSGEERTEIRNDGISMFSTPTVVHFGATLMIAAVLSAPWHRLVHPALILDAVGLCGIVYVLRLMRRTRRLTVYRADIEDWISYMILPTVAYGAILLGSFFLPLAPVNALFVLAGGVVVLIFLGIHNAWDVVTYLAAGRPNNSN